MMNQIFWVVRKDYQPMAFAILYKGSKKEFNAASDSLLQLKQLIGKEIIHATIKDFYNPIKLLGQGGTAQVKNYF